MKRQRDERHEAVGLVLQFAQLHQVIDALFFGFHVAVEHRGVGVQARLVRFACGVQPHLPAGLVIADDLAHPRMENFGAAAGAGIHAGFLHFLQRLFDRKFGDAREIMHLHHGEGFQVDGRAALLQAAHQFQIMIESKIRVQPADDVEFRGAFANALFGALIDFIERKSVSARERWGRGRRRKACSARRRHWWD